MTVADQANDDHADLVLKAVRLQPLLREYLPKAEEDRTLPDEVNKALTEAGFFRLRTPKRFGGYEARMRTLLEVTETLGAADGSAAWMVSVGSTSGWLAGLFSEQARQEIFGKTPEPRIAGGIAEVAARRVDGGLRVSGRWSYSTGADRADWSPLGTAIADDSGQIVGAAMSMVPISELTLERTWHTVGMRGTATDTLIADDVFVPEYRTIDIAAVFEGQRPFPVAEPMYRAPLGPVAVLPLLGPTLGLGRAALDLVIEKAPKKSMRHTFFTRQTDSVGVQIQVAQAAVKLKTARLLAYSIADELDTGAAVFDYTRRAEIHAEFAHAAQEVLEAIAILLNVHGAGSFAEASRMQQYWRDANTGARHAALNPFVAYEVYGKDLLGVEERISTAV
jgi:3-hydroxy-9,10-secoandrosta-1,3,5(10)-triene-9,17-dione monooxygenase